MSQSILLQNSVTFSFATTENARELREKNLTSNEINVSGQLRYRIIIKLDSDRGQCCNRVRIEAGTVRREEVRERERKEGTINEACSVASIHFLTSASHFFRFPFRSPRQLSYGTTETESQPANCSLKRPFEK